MRSSSLVVVVFYESVIRSKKQQIGYSFSSSSRNATDVCALFSAIFLCELNERKVSFSLDGFERVQFLQRCLI